MKENKLKRIVVILILLVMCISMTACVNINISIDDDSDDNNVSTEQQVSQEPLMSRDEVVTIILKRADDATEHSILSLETDFDDGRWVYEGSVLVDNMVFEFEIDGDNGNILEWEYDD